MIDLDVQNPCGFETIPDAINCQRWVEAAIQKDKASIKSSESSVVIRFVDEDEGLELNHTYRNKNSATNVLSFPFEAPGFLSGLPGQEGLDDEPTHLGDLVLCEPVVLKEASEQNKSKEQHWAHLIIHGTLHLQGYDHLNDDEASIMESLEIKILENLGFSNPYHIENE